MLPWWWNEYPKGLLQVKPLHCEATFLDSPRSQSVAPHRLSLPEATEVLARSHAPSQEGIYVAETRERHNGLLRALLAGVTDMLLLTPAL